MVERPDEGLELDCFSVDLFLTLSTTTTTTTTTTITTTTTTKKNITIVN